MQINGKEYRSVYLEDQRLKMIDQNKLPHEFVIAEYENYPQVAKAIREMTVRGAPAIGAAGAYGLALAAQNAPEERFRSYLRSAREELIATRPTAIDLNNGVNYVYESTLKFIPDYPHARKVAIMAAKEFAQKSEDECQALSKLGEAIIPQGARILTHCNAGALATVDCGTALGVIRMAHKKGKDIFVYVDETRPRFQGARLTAFELEQEGIPHAIIPDSASGYYFWKKEIDLVITGADRVCLNGDIANKIGTYQKAILAKEHCIPFYVSVPLSTFDLTCKEGGDIPIEFRPDDEVSVFGGVQLSNPGSPVLNPSFDITPASYITSIITPAGIFAPEEAAKKAQG